MNSSLALAHGLRIDLRAWSYWLIRAAALTVFGIGCMGLAGWILDVTILKSVLPLAVEMKFNTSLSLMALGMALYLLGRQSTGRGRRPGQVLALCAGAIGLATLSQYFFGWELGIDELLFDDRRGVYAALPGRMSPFSAGAIACAMAALLLLARRSTSTFAYVAAAIPLALGLVTLLGYSWNAPEITTDLMLPPVALNTALALLLLGLGTLAALAQCSLGRRTEPMAFNSIEGKILLGFIASFLMLAIGGGTTYKAIAVFAQSARLVAHTQEVRGALDHLDSVIADAGLAQRNYLISGQNEQLEQYLRTVSQVSIQAALLGGLTRDNPAQTANLMRLESEISRLLGLLDEGLSLYQKEGFNSAKRLVDSPQNLVATRAIDSLIQKMDAEEAALLFERESAYVRFQRYMLASMLLTMAVATLIFAVLFRQIRQEIRRRQLADKALIGALTAAELSRSDADAANHAKSAFLATMSHEIRTPMNGMLGMLELLGLTQLDSAQRTTLKIVSESGHSLMRILDDILDFSKIEAMKLDIHPEPVRLAHLVQDFHTLYAGNASGKGLVINCRIDPTLSPALMVDPLRLRQILGNLLSNAIKFTSRGTIDISAVLIERLSGVDRVRISVRDTGIGISAAHQRHLFQPFSQAQASTSQRYGGTGLGLAISRRLAALLGGTLSMDSEPGKGTTMMLELTLPIASESDLPAPVLANKGLPGQPGVASRRPAPDVEQAEAEGTLLLLADDHPTNRSLMLRQANLLGYAVEVARDGVEALHLWGSGRFSLVLTDCNMPEMDGYELARAIRTHESALGLPRIPIIACTANALPGEIEVCLSAGMDDYLAKPVELKHIMAKLDRWLPLPASEAMPSFASTPPESPEPPGQKGATAVQEAADKPVAEAATRAEGAGNALKAIPRRAARPIDHGVLARMTSGNAVLEHALFGEFRGANDRDMAHLRQAVACQDEGETWRLAHLIKGAAEMLGATHLASACERIEKASRKKDSAGMAACLGKIEQEVTALNQYLDELIMAHEGPASSGE